MVIQITVKLPTVSKVLKHKQAFNSFDKNTLELWLPFYKQWSWQDKPVLVLQTFKSETCVQITQKSMFCSSSVSLHVKAIALC